MVHWVLVLGTSVTPSRHALINWYACVAYIGLTSKQGTQRKSREKKDILKNQGKSGKL